MERMGRKRALLGLTIMAVGALTILAPASAFAQSVPDVTDPVGSTVDTVTGGGGGNSESGSGGGGGVTDTVTDPVTDTVDKTTGTVGGVVDNTGGTVDNVAPGAPVGDTKKTVDEVGQRTEDTVAGTVGSVQEGAGNLGGEVLSPVLNAKSPRNPDRDGDGKVSKNERIAAAQQRKQAIENAAAERAQRSAAEAKDRSLAALEKNRRAQGSTPAPSIAPPPRETFLTQLADAAVEATKKLAFPLGLALMVGAFLMVQGRIDRKDAKLALAPIDSEQDLLSFQ